VPVPAVAFLIVGVVGYLAFKGSELALRAQIPLMILIGLSLLVLVLGVFTREPVTVMGPAPAGLAPGFWVVFAVFFPAVTGIMAGLGLSGDLRDPIRSIPRGALAATLVGFAIYLALPLLLLQGATREALRQEPLIWTKIAPLGVLLVMPGLWRAIFSSAVGSVLGAPRTLQAPVSFPASGRNG
jgi:amino acid transporter